MFIILANDAIWSKKTFPSKVHNVFHILFCISCFALLYAKQNFWAQKMKTFLLYCYYNYLTFYCLFFWLSVLLSPSFFCVLVGLIQAEKVSTCMSCQGIWEFSSKCQWLGRPIFLNKKQKKTNEQHYQQRNLFDSSFFSLTGFVS